MLDQTQAPLIEMLQVIAERSHAPFYAPGHKRGEGIAPELKQWWGRSVFQADLPELPELDNLFAPEGVIQAAQQLAAEVFGARESWFLVNGSSCGIIAAILATCRSRENIILPRNVHRSVISGLIVSGAMPIFIQPEYDPEWDFAYGISAEDVATALAAHPDVKAVMTVYPTYHGVCANVAKLTEIVHQYGIPLLVDEAHGAHFAFHSDLPTSALAVEADLTVQSIHKVLGAMTQASMLHVQGELIDRDRLTQALQMVQSSSPSYLLLASLDAARRQMATAGTEHMAQTLKLAADARVRISRIPGLSMLESPTMPCSGFCDLDPTRLTVRVSDLGLTGYQADELLHEEFGVTAELPGLEHLTFMITLGNTAKDIDRLVAGLQRLSQDYFDPGLVGDLHPFEPMFLGVAPMMDPISVMTPREAFFAPTMAVPIDETVGSISAELVCPYPPGIPLLMPGEEITPSCLELLKKIWANGGTITGCSDRTLKTLNVVRIVDRST